MSDLLERVTTAQFYLSKLDAPRADENVTPDEVEEAIKKVSILLSTLRLQEQGLKVPAYILAEGGLRANIPDRGALSSGAPFGRQR